MIWQVYSVLMLFATILMIFSVFSKSAPAIKCVICALSFGLFALLALSSFNVTAAVTTVDGDLVHRQYFEPTNRNTMAWINALGFIIAFILFVVNVLLSLADYNTPLWKKRLRNKGLID